MNKINPWDAARKKQLCRYDIVSKKEILLERGVNFFVLMLERLGATTRFSCEGHPHGFYIVFTAWPELAREVAKIGFFGVNVGRLEDDYAIRLEGNERYHDAQPGEVWDEKAKRSCLRHAADAWVERFGLPESELVLGGGSAGPARAGLAELNGAHSPIAKLSREADQ